jgi:RHS repeat-associated protein
MFSNTSNPRPKSNPFGSSINTRSYSAGSGFRFGFNGKENFDNYQDYGFRIYYPNLGKFLTVDPLIDDYHFYTPYQFSGNNCIRFVDLDGLEPADPMSYIWTGFGDGFIGIANWFDATVSWGLNITESTKTSTKTVGNTTTTSGLEISSKSVTSSNFGSILSTLKNSGRPMSTDELPDLTKTTKTTKISGYNQIEVKTKKGTITTKTTGNQTEAKVEMSANIQIKVQKVPLDIKASQTKSTSGQTERQVQGSISSGNTAFKAAIIFNNNSANNKSSINTSVGTETNVGNSKIKFDIFINIGGSN